MWSRCIRRGCPSGILKHLDDQDKESGGDSKGGAAKSLISIPTGKKADSIQTAENLKYSLAWLARYAVDGLWDVVKHSNGEQAKAALQLLIITGRRRFSQSAGQDRQA